MPVKRLGLIAGAGKFPFLFARAAKMQGYEVVAAGVQGDASWRLRFAVDRYASFPVGELKRLLAFLKQEDLQQVIMAGQVRQRHLFDAGLHLDAEFRQLFEAIQDRRADTIFAAIGEALRVQGLELVDSTFLLKEYLAPAGVLSARQPTDAQRADISFGRGIAKAMGALDVGQTVVVCDKAIVAIEAMEGTDQTIFRGGRIARQGAVVIKMSKPEQDRRFDVPVIGPRTLKIMRRARVTCLAIEAGHTLIIDQARCVQYADAAGIAIVAV